MSTVPHEASPTTDHSLANLLFDHPSADTILRSHDSFYFRVPKAYILNSSPVLGELIRKALGSLGDANAEASLPVVPIPESGNIIRCLLSFIFPVTPLLPSTPEEIMELLSVAQKYEMETALTHIRGSIGLQNSLSTQRLESALHIYSLTQKYRLRPEALQAAQAILLNQSMIIEDFDNGLAIVTGASLYELWKYHERVRAILALDLPEFRASCARGTITGLHCTVLSSSQIPFWLDHFVESIERTPNQFNFVGLNTAMACHIKETADDLRCECSSIPTQTIGEFWEALEFVVRGSFDKVSMVHLQSDRRTCGVERLQAESALSLVRDQNAPQAQINSTMFPLEIFHVSDANFIIRSSDLVDFRVHKSVLAMASPIFEDLLSLPQYSDSEAVDGLPVVQLSESSELLNSLIPMLYPVPTVVPNSYDKVSYILVTYQRNKLTSWYKVLYLLAACQKYEMASVQSFIRAEVNRRAYPAPNGVEAFTAYAIASANELIPETERAARLTLNLPMTFKVLGEGLRLFEGWALHDLVKFRRRCAENLVTCLDSFLAPGPGPSRIWIGCPEVAPVPPSLRVFTRNTYRIHALPKWFNELFTWAQNELKCHLFTRPLNMICSEMRQEYGRAIRNHASCDFCLTVHRRNSQTFYSALKNKLILARNKVLRSHYFQVPRTKIHLSLLTLSRYAAILAHALVRLIPVLGIV